MNILITGGAGYIGSHTVLSFLEAGHHVVVLDDLSTGHQEILPYDVTFYKGCVSNSALVTRILKEHNIRTVVHFAGSISVEESVTNPEKYYKNNTVNSRILIEACVEAGVTRFIFSSTAATYAEVTNGASITESYPQKPVSPYGESKLRTEQNLIETAAQHPTFNYGILRYFNVAGADVDARTGQCMAKATSLIQIASEVASGKRDKMCVYGDDYSTADGTCVRDYIHVSDLADIHKCLVEHIAKTPSNHILNCGYGQGFSVKDVLNAYEKFLGKPLNSDISARRLGDVPFVVANNSALLNTLNWQAKHASLDAIIKSAYNWAIKWENRDA